MSVENLASKIETSPKQEPKVAVAMLSFLGKETIYLPFSTLGTYRKFAEDAGATLDFWPIKGVSAWQVYFGAISKASLDAISSASASFRAEKTWKETISHPNKKLAVMARLALPHKDNVGLLNDLSNQKHAHSRIHPPIVLDFETIEEAAWLTEIGSRNRQGISVTGIHNVIVQATEGLFNRWDIKIRTEQDIDRFLKKYNISGFCFNTVESRFLYDNPDLLEAVLRRTMVVYVKVFRSDGSDPDLSTAHGLDIKNKSQQTDILKRLEKIRKINPQVLFVIVTNISEVPKDPKLTGADTILVPESVGPAIKPLVDGIKSIG